MICDGSFPTTMLTHWTRDRTRGPKLPLERIVRMQTRDTARAVGLLDRGLLATGYRADLNVIDYDRLRLSTPEVAYDLPAGGRRLIQRAKRLSSPRSCGARSPIATASPPAPSRGACCAARRRGRRIHPPSKHPARKGDAHDAGRSRNRLRMDGRRCRRLRAMDRGAERSSRSPRSTRPSPSPARDLRISSRSARATSLFRRSLHGSSESNES